METEKKKLASTRYYVDAKPKLALRFERVVSSFGDIYGAKAFIMRTAMEIVCDASEGDVELAFTKLQALSRAEPAIDERELLPTEDRQ